MFLTFFLDGLKPGNSFEYFSEYKDFSIYTLVWLSLKKRKYKDALLRIEKFESEIIVKKLYNQLIFASKERDRKKLFRGNKIC